MLFKKSNLDCEMTMRKTTELWEIQILYATTAAAASDSTRKLKGSARVRARTWRTRVARAAAAEHRRRRRHKEEGEAAVQTRMLQGRPLSLSAVWA
jgi:hypothetical protein